MTKIQKKLVDSAGETEQVAGTKNQVSSNSNCRIVTLFYVLRMKT
jgi:hypothetical protein